MTGVNQTEPNFANCTKCKLRWPSIHAGCTTYLENGLVHAGIDAAGINLIFSFLKTTAVTTRLASSHDAETILSE